MFMGFFQGWQHSKDVQEVQGRKGNTLNYSYLFGDLNVKNLTVIFSAGVTIKDVWKILKKLDIVKTYLYD